MTGNAISDAAASSLAAARAAGLWGEEFVGRARELTILAERFELAQRPDQVTGVDVLLMAGEPGVGKTRLARHFAATVRSRGGLVLLGRCYEGEWAPPYGPWVEALGDHLSALPPARLPALLGERASLLARLVPALAIALPDIPPTSLPSGDEERFRLFDAVADVLRDLAANRPMLVLIDDLQWADAGSLALIRHVVRRRDVEHVLLLGTYRDVGLPRGHPLLDLLAALPRETGRPSGVHQLRLKGLPRPEGAALLEQRAGRALTPETVRLLLRSTGGNPFFLQELVRHLIEDGRFIPAGPGERWAITGTPEGLGVPDGIRQVVEGRIARVRPETGRLLRRVAAFTGGFDFRVAEKLTELSEEELLDALDEAIDAGLIQAVDGRAERYEFVHAIVRQTIIEAWSPSRRVRLHRQAAEALRAAYPGHESEHAAELATQYHASTALPGAESGIAFALLAADRGRASFAWEQEVAFLRIARDLAAGTDPATRALVLRRLAIAEAEAVYLDAALETTEVALAALAEAGSDDRTTAEFIVAVARALAAGGAPEPAVRPLVHRGLALCGERHDLTWARLMTVIGPIAPLHRGYIVADRWLGHDPEAVAIIRREGTAVDYARSLDALEPSTRAETDALLALTESWDNPTAIHRALRVVLRQYVYRHGAPREAEAVALRLLEIGERSGSIPSQAEALTYLTRLLSARGDFTGASETQARALPLLARLGPAHRLHSAPQWIEIFLALFLDGDWPRIAAHWTRLATHPTGNDGLAAIHAAALAAQAHARAGAEVETRRLLVELVPLLETVGFDFYGHSGAVSTTGGAVWDLALADPAPRLRALAERQIALGIGDVPSTSRHLTVARMLALEGDLDAALAAFATAREALETSSQRPLRAMVDYDEALARRRAGERSPVTTRLAETARTAFLALGMKTWAERAVELAGGRAGTTQPIATTGLTARELDVLRLIARGLSDRQVGEQLGLSSRTVGTHVRHMLAKTALDNRTELSVWAVERGLVASNTT